MNTQILKYSNTHISPFELKLDLEKFDCVI